MNQEIQKIITPSVFLRNQSLCIYRDEAIGATPVPLTITGENLKVSKSSHYFSGDGIKINLLLDGKNKIQQVQLGPDICINLSALNKGIEVGPFGLLPVHTLQSGQNFDPFHGGLLQFGFLKKIICFKSIALLAKNLICRLLRITSKNSSSAQQDLAKLYQNYFGNSTWGIYEILVKKDIAGNWMVESKSLSAVGQPAKELVARFQVNKIGIVLGIQEMYCV